MKKDKATKSSLGKLVEEALNAPLALTRETQVTLLRQLLTHRAFKELLMPRWHSVREKIIAKGKASRSEDKRIQMWAALDACDAVIDAPFSMLKEIEGRGYVPPDPLKRS